MVLFRRDTTDGPDPWLEAKVALFFVAAALVIAAMLMDSVWLIRAATLVLVLALLLRFVDRPGKGADEEDSGGHP